MSYQPVPSSDTDLSPSRTAKRAKTGAKAKTTDGATPQELVNQHENGLKLASELLEDPMDASSWKEKCVQHVTRMEEVMKVVADQCQ